MSLDPKKPAPPRVIAFDWDGTLFDSMAYKPRNAGLVFAALCNVNADDVESLYRTYTGVPRREVFQLIANSIGVAVDDSLFATMSARFTELNLAAATTTKPFDDALRALPILAVRAPLYVSSSAPQDELTAVVAHSGIQSHFAAVWGSSKDFNKGKEHFAKICGRESCSLAEILFVGDDDADAALAKAAGVPFCRIRRGGGNTIKSSEISSLDELAAALKV